MTENDLQQCRQENEKLKEALRQAQRAQRVTHLGNWELDLVKNVLWWSDEIYRIFEIEPEKFGASYEAFLDAIHPDDRDFVNKAYTDSVEMRAPFNIEHRLLMKDGGIKYVNERCETSYADDGTPLRSIGTTLEITDLKEVEEELRCRVEEAEKARQAMLYMLEDLNESSSKIANAKREWEETFDAVDDMISVHDKEYNILKANKAVCRKFGKEAHELIGRKCYTLLHGTEEAIAICPHKNTMEGEVPTVEEVEDEHLGGSFLVSTYPVFDSEGEFYAAVHIAKDITEIKRAEQKLQYEMEVTTNLLTIADAISKTTGLDRLMEKISIAVNNVMRSDITLSYLWNRERGIFQACHSYGLHHEQIPFFRTEPLDGKVIEQLGVKSSEFGGSITPNSKVRTFNLFPWIKEINTVGIIPLIGREGFLGLMICIYRSEPGFTGRESRLMVGISQQLSTAIEEARLYTESLDKAMDLSHKIETIEVMHEIDRNILSSLNRQEVLETTIKMISKLVPCDRTTVVLVDRERQGFTYEAGFGVCFLSKGAFMPFGDTSITEVVSTGRPQYVANLKETGVPLSIERSLMEEGFLSHIRVPLTVKGEIIGVLNVGSKRPSAYTPADLSTLQKTADQIGVALENARLVEDLKGLLIGTIESLSSAIDAKSPWTKGHSERVTRYALRIGRQLGFEERELDALELAGLLHDIGKLATYETILDKPGRLSEEEISVIQQHPAKGADILSPIKQFGSIIPDIKYHHEFYDGKGYPEGLKGEDIPLMARILTVADTVDAMHSDRPYRTGKSMEEVIGELKRCSGSQFDPAMVEAFLKALEGGSGSKRTTT